MKIPITTQNLIKYFKNIIEESPMILPHNNITMYKQLQQFNIIVLILNNGNFLFHNC